MGGMPKPKAQHVKHAFTLRHVFGLDMPPQFDAMARVLLECPNFDGRFERE